MESVLEVALLGFFFSLFVKNMCVQKFTTDNVDCHFIQSSLSIRRSMQREFILVPIKSL